MSEQTIDLKGLERKVWTSFFEDGLWDIFIGLFFLSMGIRSLTDNVVFTLILLPAFLVVMTGKRFITIPRIGYVKFQNRQRARSKKVIGILAFAILLSIILLFFTLSGHIPGARITRAVFQGIALACTFILIAHLIYFKRLYVYGIFFTVGMMLWEFFGQSVGQLIFIIVGGVTLVVGVWLLVIFLHKYPASASEVSHDSTN